MDSIENETVAIRMSQQNFELDLDTVRCIIEAVNATQNVSTSHSEDPRTNIYNKLHECLANLKPTSSSSSTSRLRLSHLLSYPVNGGHTQQLPWPDSLHDYKDKQNLEVSITKQHQSLDECSSYLQQWDEFNVFSLTSLSGGKPLQYVTVALLDKYNLVERLSIPRDRLTAFLEKLEGSYNTLPYHYSTHAADVVQAIGVSLKMDAWGSALDDIELLAVIIAAAMHDVGHPGVSNAFHSKAKTEAEVLYQGNSTNEQLHITYGMHLLHEDVHGNFINHLSREQQIKFRKVVISTIIATDMACHTRTLETFDRCVKEEGSDFSSWSEEGRLIALQMALHCADISSPARPRHLSCLWGLRVQEEFCRQGDLETTLGLPVVQFCDRTCTTAQQNQIDFISNSLIPALEIFHSIAPQFVETTVPLARQSLDYWSDSLPTNNKEEEGME